jgi:hypothetical protein
VPSVAVSSRESISSFVKGNISCNNYTIFEILAISIFTFWTVCLKLDPQHKYCEHSVLALKPGMIVTSLRATTQPVTTNNAQHGTSPNSKLSTLGHDLL